MKSFPISLISKCIVGLCLLLSSQVVASGQYNAFARSVSESIAVGSSGLIIKSNDGQNWTSVNSGVTVDLFSVAWSGNIYAAVGAGGTILSSENGNLWISRSGQSTEDFVQVLWGGQFFVAFRTGGQALTSVDGVNWQERPATDPILSLSLIHI